MTRPASSCMLQGRQRMKTLVIYDSVHGNTRKIAEAIGEAVSGEVKVQRAGEVDASRLKEFDLLFVGAPTHGGRPNLSVV